MSADKTNFRLEGATSGPVVTLAHPAGTRLDVWDGQIEALAPGFRILLYDVRGHGGSEVPAGPYTLDEMAGDLRELLKYLGIARTHFVGLSMGAQIGITAALKYPEIIASLVLCGSTAYYGPELGTLLEKRVRDAESEGMSTSLVEEMIAGWFSVRFRETHSVAVERVRAMLREADSSGYAAAVSAIATVDLRERLGGIRCPTLVVVGEQDGHTPPSMARDIHERILGSRLLVLPGAGHCVAIEAAQRLNPALVNFLSEQAFPECEEVSDDRPIRQGDIFQWTTPGESPWDFLGVIVTADCDIEKKRHRGILSYVPIITINDYTRLFYLPAALSKALVPLGEQVIRLMREHQQRNRPDFPEPLSGEAAVEWIQSRRPEDIAAELRVQEGGVRSTLVDLVTDYQIANRALDGEAFQDQFDALMRLRSRKDPSITSARLLKELYGNVAPDDCLFIGRIGLDYRMGYIAYLRLVREILQEDLAIKQIRHPRPQPRDTRPEPKARRIARLQSPYIYRLTQQLVEVFASIGLPNEYDKRRERLVELHASGLTLLITRTRDAEM